MPKRVADTSSETAELVDLYFINPLGAIFARLAQSLRMTPSQVTVVGALVGVAAGTLLYDPRYGWLAFSLLIFHAILDSADGHLARLTGQVTELGRVLDGVSGYVTHAAIYLAIGAGVMHRGGSSSILLWMVLAGFATVAQAQMYDYHRTAFKTVIGEGLVPRNDPGQVGPWLHWLYRSYVALQRWLIGQHVEAEAALATRSRDGIVRQEDRINYREHFHALVRGWNLLGDNVRRFAIGGLLLIDRLDLLFVFVLLPMNFGFLLLWLWQRRADQRFLASL